MLRYHLTVLFFKMRLFQFHFYLKDFSCLILQLHLYLKVFFFKLAMWIVIKNPALFASKMALHCRFHVIIV
jgi:hypothetical protein